MKSLDDKWNRTHDALYEILSVVQKSTCQDMNDGIGDIADDLNELRATERRKLSSMSQEETPLLDEFRSAFQEVSRWINRAEAHLGTNRESQERAIGQEIDEWAPKMGNLRRMAEKLVQLFVNQREDVEPEMASLHQRWEHIVQAVEKRLKSNQAFRMVEVEEVKTTISHLSIPLPEPVVTITQPSPVVDPDEEIETLIEEEPSQTPVTKIRFSQNKSHYAMPDGSSSESLSGSSPIVPKVGESRVKSPPPQPLPKPRWYLEQRAKGIKMPISPERVKVIENTLPSPQNLVGKVEATSSDERQMPEKAVLTSVSTTPSTTIDSPSSTTNSVVEDELLKENAVIDHLLAETELQLEEVAKHVRGLATAKDKEQQDFEEQTRFLISKIEAASRKIDETEQEQDLQLRKELITREMKVVETDVKNTLSKGDNLALLMKRKSSKDYDSLVDHLTDLRNVWKTMQSRTEQKKTVIAESEIKVKQFRKEVDQLKRWLSGAKVKLVRATHDEVSNIHKYPF